MLPVGREGSSAPVSGRCLKFSLGTSCVQAECDLEQMQAAYDEDDVFEVCRRLKDAAAKLRDAGTGTHVQAALAIGDGGSTAQSSGVSRGAGVVRPVSGGGASAPAALSVDAPQFIASPEDECAEDNVEAAIPDRLSPTTDRRLRTAGRRLLLTDR